MGLQDGALLQEGRWEGLPAGGQLSSLGLDPSEGSLGGDRTAERDVLDPQLPTPWLQSPVPSMGAPVQTHQCHCWFEKEPSARCPGEAVWQQLLS